MSEIPEIETRVQAAEAASPPPEPPMNLFDVFSQNSTEPPLINLKLINDALLQVAANSKPIVPRSDGSLSVNNFVLLAMASWCSPVWEAVLTVWERDQLINISQSAGGKFYQIATANPMTKKVASAVNVHSPVF